MTTTTGQRGLTDKIARLNWGVITLLCALACFGVIMHFSVAEGSWAGMPLSHAWRFGFILLLTIILAVVDVRLWFNIAYPLYAVALLLLVAVAAVGETRMGAQRWLDVGPVQIQPSEIMKVAIILALGRYYHQLDPKTLTTPTALARSVGPLGWAWNTIVLAVRETPVLLAPILMIGLPTALVMHQPDLGTALLILGTGLGVMFLAGLRWRYIISAAMVAIPGAVYAFFNVLHDYQRERVYTFLNPDADRMGAGYHVMQSKIAIGAAGVFGQGYLRGPQSQLDFLPEKHTDFIFTMIVEEFGLIGAFAVLSMFAMLLGVTMSIALRARTLFGRLAAGGVAITLGLYVCINTAMVIGLIPVVGIPLPLLSYGGTAMLTVMMGMAIVLSIHLHRETSINARGFLW